ncbi:MAG: transcription elongation factor GreA [Patescibacteria group bacterium]
MPHFVTQEGLKKIKEEIEYLENVAMQQVIERIAAARELGDLKENSEYSSAKEEQGLLVARIGTLKALMKDIAVVEQSKDHSHVRIGSTVVVESSDKKRFEYMIVGTEETNPSLAKISYESPMGRAFLEKQKGDNVAVGTPRGMMEYRIIEIK